MLYRMVYISRAEALFKEYQLLELLEQARSYNSKHDITGMLLYKDLSFIQLLEGPQEAVNTLFASIKRDRRHKHIKELLNEMADSRIFTGWSMGYQRYDKNTPLPKGYSDYLSDSSMVEERWGSNPPDTLKLLALFKSWS